ncbi:hypothetical protein TNCV_3003541 [Trichonephila clavipes]|nr:hypothetical protein TNCV_3003541 [Trichonephila clavipes]
MGRSRYQNERRPTPLKVFNAQPIDTRRKGQVKSQMDRWPEKDLLVLRNKEMENTGRKKWYWARTCDKEATVRYLYHSATAATGWSGKAMLSCNPLIDATWSPKRDLARGPNILRYTTVVKRECKGPPAKSGLKPQTQIRTWHQSGFGYPKNPGAPYRGGCTCAISGVTENISSPPLRPAKSGFRSQIGSCKGYVFGVSRALPPPRCLQSTPKGGAAISSSAKNRAKLFHNGVLNTGNEVAVVIWPGDSLSKAAYHNFASAELLRWLVGL